MDPKKVGDLIKSIRKKNNLTQKEFADKYGVTYQAVSKWENGINLPDISLIRQISKDFNVSIESILDGENIEKESKKNKYILIVIFLIITLLVIVLLALKNNQSFTFKTVSSSCKDFKVTGSLAYDKNKSAIYISNVDYCGGNDQSVYKKINCSLYEKTSNKIVKIGDCNINKKNIKLEDYLKYVRLNINNYTHMCKKYSDENLYLEIEAYKNNREIITYKIPLKITDDCDK